MVVKEKLMARESHDWKVFGPDGVYVASCRDPKTAAIVVDEYGRGSVVKFGHTKIVWREGFEQISAGDSLDMCATVLKNRKAEIIKASYIRAYGQEHYDNVMAGRA
jgi:hypothetical protein